MPSDIDAFRRGTPAAADAGTFELAKRLPASLLYRRCDPAELPFDVCSELEQAPGLIGQTRAEQALEFALRMRAKGYNVYALGATGSGRHDMVEQVMHRKADGEAAPPDTCYVNNFDDSQRPRLLRLPAGRGNTLAASMRKFIEELRADLPAAFERDDYRARREALDQQLQQRSEATLAALQRRAEAEGIRLLRTPSGLALAPVRDGKVLEPEQFGRLPAAEQHRIQQQIEAIQGELETMMRQVPLWERERREAVQALNRETTGLAIAHLMAELRAEYQDLPQVLEYFAAVERDVKDNIDDFLTPMAVSPPPAEGAPASPPLPVAALREAQDARFRRYRVNVLVDNSALRGAPVIYEDNPTHQNLVGRAEHLARFGALVTDFNLLVAGALHRANGGYLVLDAPRLLAGNYGWASLKRALNAGQIRIETLEQLLSMPSTASLDPEPVPLAVKVVLVGPPALYYQLSQVDEEMGELFKIAADFEERIDRTPETTLLYARMICGLSAREKLRPFDRGAVARVIEQAARLAGDADKLSANVSAFVDLLREADQHAADAGRDMVGVAEVQAAIDAQFRRGDRIYRRMQEEIGRHTIRVETDGERIGQINGLSVITLGAGLAFGSPTRITAQVRLGRGEVVDIEREVELGGPLHSKGMLILSGFLGGRFGQTRPLSLRASVVFEQSYGGVDGDSASAAELFALLSALADAPIRQSFAVTGSVDQHGQIQAIGGVNEKIEGFFDACRVTGFTGRQGVIIPAANVKHLMLRHDIVAAAAEDRFAIYPIDTVDQGIELLTGLRAGEAGPDGDFPKGSVNQRVAARLDAFAAKIAESRQFADRTE